MTDAPRPTSRPRSPGNLPRSPSNRSRPRRVLSLVSRREAARVSRVFRAERVGGVAIMIAALLGFLAANSPLAAGTESLREFRVGPAALGLDLTLGTWAADGLLAIFFFMVGLELKREFATGALRHVSTAIVPVAAAVGGVVVPALLFAAITAGGVGASGWPIPTATDIAFAVTVLALLAPRLPPALRVFLLTLAVVDDFIAIGIIAVLTADGIRPLPLLAALVPLALYALVARRATAWLVRVRWAPWLVLLPLGAVTWAFVHASGVHATVAGVLLAATVPVSGRHGASLAEVFEHRFAPLSSGIAVPVFAFFAAGVAISGGSRFPIDPIAFGILAGLVIGKPLGIALTTWLLTRFTRAELDPAVSWRELIGVAALGGIGFTVSLLVTDLTLPDPADADTARLAVIAASLLSAAVAAAFLVRRPRSGAERARSQRAC